MPLDDDLIKKNEPESGKKIERFLKLLRNFCLLTGLAGLVFLITSYVGPVVPRFLIFSSLMVYALSIAFEFIWEWLSNRD